MSTKIKLIAEERQQTGHNVKKIRKNGQTPCVVYGKNYSSKNIQINTINLFKVYRDAGYTHVINLEMSGSVQPCLIHDIDIDPVNHRIRHVDFLAVNLKEDIETIVPIKLVGESPGTKLGLVLSNNLDEITIKSKPDNIPEFIEVDISGLEKESDAIRIIDIKEKNKNQKYEIIAKEEELDLVIVSLVAEDEEEIDEETTSTNEEKKPE